MWNFKRNLWNSAQNILPIHWKIHFSCNIEVLRALRFKSSYAFLKHPPDHHQPGHYVLASHDWDEGGLQHWNLRVVMMTQLCQLWSQVAPDVMVTSTSITASADKIGIMRPCDDHSLKDDINSFLVRWCCMAMLIWVEIGSSYCLMIQANVDFSFMRFCGIHLKAISQQYM